MPDSGQSETAAPATGQRGPDFVAPGLPDGTAPPAVQPVPFHGQLGPYLGGTNPPAPHQPAGPPPYGPVPPPEPGAAEPPKRPARLVWVSIAAAVAVLAIVVAVAALTRQQQPPPVAQGPVPEDTARAFVDAGYRSDCDAARKTIDEEFWDRAGLTCLDVSFHGSEFVDTTMADWAFTDTEVTGDLASITLDPPGEIPPTVLRMRLIDGSWRITDWQF